MGTSSNTPVLECPKSSAFVFFVERPKKKSKPYNFWVNLITNEHPWQDFEKERREAIRTLLNTVPILLFVLILVLYSCVDLIEGVNEL